MGDNEYQKLQKAIIGTVRDMCNIKYNGRKMTVHRLAAFSGVSRSCLLSILNGETDNIGIKTIWKLCKASGISLSDFFADIENAVSETRIDRVDPSSIEDLARDNPYIKANLTTLKKSIRVCERYQGNDILYPQFKEEAISCCKQITGYISALEDLDIISTETSEKLIGELSELMGKLPDNSNARIEEIIRMLKGESDD